MSLLLCCLGMRRKVRPEELLRKGSRRISVKYLLLLVALVAASVALALEGEIRIHDPSTVVRCDNKFYTYGTGGSSLVSADGWTWSRGTPLPRRGLAPDVIHLADRYAVYVAANIGAQPKAAINMIWSKSLDPASPDYKWEEGGVVASSDGIEDSNAIDPGVFLDPTDGRLWLVYGSYFGYIRLIELDPKTGGQLKGAAPPRDLAINCEASDMMYRDGWYYLLATHGSCCRGTDSGYNIRVGRSKKVSGPFLDDQGVDMIQGGGKLFLGSGGRYVGPGHFGFIDAGGGLEKFSFHWEADLDRGGASVLEIRPLLWRDQWPVAGDNLKAGDYQIESVSTGTALELAVEGMPVGGRRFRGGPPPGAAPPSGTVPGGVAPGPRMFEGQGGAIPSQDVAEVSKNWPSGSIDVRMATYLLQAQQKWAITPVAGAGGYLGSPYFKIRIAGTDRALAATRDRELTTVGAFTGSDEQLWRIDQTTDGSWRIMPKTTAGPEDALVLTAIGGSFATLAKLDPHGAKQHWLLKVP